MAHATTTAGTDTSGHSLNEKILFWASFLTLIAAGIGFSVRGVIIKDWGQQFGFTQGELGAITGGGLAGFGLAIIFFSFLADAFGYGKLMLVAFLLHASSAVLTLAATPVYDALGKQAAYNCLFYGGLLFSLGNGTCEAVINPLTATLFPRNKTHWLNILHAGWPLGLILGALIVLGFNLSGEVIRWEYKLGVFLIPVLLYGLLMFNRSFPKSEASSAGIPMTKMMGTVGMIGMAVAAALLGFYLSDKVPEGFAQVGVPVPGWVGWAIAGAIWLVFGYFCSFAIGSFILAFLYLMHAMVGYVELGTDQWITNITTQVLNNENLALIAFIWTNALMFTLRFFAGPIVHKINPIGLLFVSACLGTAGLYLMGMPFTDSVWPWVGAVTVYGIGKTFYWPTLLGVISERFPKGGALALGLSGGIGMLSAGMLGAPGIGYSQDYAALQKLDSLTSTNGKATYDRYMARNDKGEPSKVGFPVVSEFSPEMLPPVAGLDNAKVKVFEDYSAKVANEEKKAKGEKFDAGALTTTLDSDLATLKKNKAEGKPVEAKLEETLTKREKWWEETGRPNFSADKENLAATLTFRAKTGLLYTAVVPAALAVGFLLLFLYFAMIGGYKQVHIEDEHGHF
jgi:MFS family permease